MSTNVMKSGYGVWRLFVPVLWTSMRHSRCASVAIRAGRCISHIWLQVQLAALYKDYGDRFRNLDYLENTLAQVAKEEQERKEEKERQLKRAQVW